MPTPLILTDINNNPFGINPDRISFYFVPQDKGFTYITAGTQQFAVLDTPESITEKIPFIPIQLTLMSQNPLYVNPNVYIAFFERDNVSVINSNVEFEVLEPLSEIETKLSQNNPIIV